MKQIEIKISTNEINYEEAIMYMESRVDEIINNNSKELLWFLNHNHDFTQGTSASKEEILKSNVIDVIKSNRGGKTTYHGPGQRIIYLLLDLRNGKKDIKQLVWNIEEWLILVLKELGLSGYRIPGLIGVWVKDPKNINADGTRDKKIAALGLRLKKWVTFHGLSFNVNPDLNFFNNINPCGISGKGVTSLQELGIEVEMEDVDKIFRRTFARIFSK